MILEYFTLARGRQSGTFLMLRCGIVARPAGGEKNFVTNEYAMLGVISGKGRYMDYQGKSWDFEPGCILQRFPGQVHTIEWNEKGATSFLAAPCPVFNLIKLLCGDGFSACPVIRGYDVTHFTEECRIVRGLFETLPENRLIEAVNRVQNLFTDIVLFQSGGNHKKTNLLDKVDKYLSAYPEKKVTVGELAKHCAVNKNSFREKFRLETGISPGRYIINKKLDAAAKLLLNQGLSIGEIADRMNYPDIYTFSRQFKKFRGITPSAYRRTPDA